MLDSSVAIVALRLVKREKQHRLEYRERRRKEGWLEYCVHGVYIGTPHGADHMCGKCEDGNDNIYAEALHEAKKRVNKSRALVEAAMFLAKEDIVGQETVAKAFLKAAQILNE